jgi:hypothetical protein
VVGMILLGVIALAVFISIGYVVRDMRKLHRNGKSLTDSPGEAAGVTAAGMTFFGYNGTH